MKTNEGVLTDEQIVEAGYMHTVEDDEPLFAFDRKELIAMVRELLAHAQPPVADGHAEQSGTGVHALRDVIANLRETGRYVDEEGESTNALEALLSVCAVFPAAPHGWKLVPVEPTREMLKAWLSEPPHVAAHELDEMNELYDASFCYRALLAASPAAPAQSGEPVAWRYQSEDPLDGGEWMLTDTKPNRRHVEPLYATPQPSHPAQSGEAKRFPTPISISTDRICKIAGKYNLGNPRLDALRGFVNEVIIVNEAEYAKSE